MKLLKTLGLLVTLVLMACSGGQPKFEGNDLASYITKDVMFEVVGKRHFTYYDLVNSVQMLANRRGIKDDMEANPIVIDAYVFDLKYEIEEKRFAATITLTGNTNETAYFDLDVGSTFDYKIFQEIIGENFIGTIFGMKSKKNIEDLKDTLEDLEKVEMIDQNIQGKAYTALPEEDVCIDHVSLGMLLYNNRGGRNNEKLMTYKYVKFDEED
jgi:hypothetical protein